MGEERWMAEVVRIYGNSAVAERALWARIAYDDYARWYVVGALK